MTDDRTPEPTGDPPSAPRRSWLSRHRGGLWTTLAAVVTVITFVTGKDNLPDLFQRTVPTDSGGSPPSAAGGLPPADTRESPPTDSRESPPADARESSPPDTRESPAPGVRAPEPIPIEASDKRGAPRPALLTVVGATQDDAGVYVSVTLEAADAADGTLYYLYQATNPESSEVDRFQLVDAAGNTFEQTGQLGIPIWERSRFQLACAPFSSAVEVPFVLQFEGARLTGDATLVHLPDPRRFTYRECEGTTIILPLFRVAVPAPTG